MTDQGQRQAARDIAKRIIASHDSNVIRAYVRLRFAIFRPSFLARIDSYLPGTGDVLDLGCGFGAFTAYFGIKAGKRRMLGLDIDSRRISRATSSAASLGLNNVRFAQGDIVNWRTHSRFDAAYLFDVVHHLPSRNVESLLATITSLLKPGGVLVIKEIEDTPRLKVWFTLALDRMMVGTKSIRYWPAGELTALLRKLGLTVEVVRVKDILPYPHIIYICRRNS